MKLKSLRALLYAVEEGSMRSAARKLGVSQPALTKAIRELEMDLGATLLDRSSKGVIATAQGKALYDRATRAVGELATAVDEIRQLGGQMVGELTVGAVPLAVMLLIPEALRTFGREFPEVRLRVSEELFFAQLQRLRGKQVDVAVSGIPEGLASGEFIVEELMSTTMVVAVRKGNPLARCRSLADLGKAKWVYTGPGGESGYAKVLHEVNGLPPPPSGAVVNSTLALLSLIGSGEFVGLMPKQLMSHPLAAQYLAEVPIVEGGLPLRVGTIIRADSAVSPLLRHFIAHLHRSAHHVAHLAA